MSYKIISKKIILVIPLLFFTISFIRVVTNYYENKKNVGEFISEQSKLVDSLYMVHRAYYQELYINETIKLDEKTVVGLPAFSASKIFKKFSNNNRLHIQMALVSDRARNPKNKADKYELKAIKYFKNNLDSKEYFAQENDFYQYATPLKIDKKCLTCHGRKEDAPKFISKKYDNAYNYKLGEIRGILSIKVPTKYINDIFNKQFFSSLIYDFVSISIVILIAFYLIKFFSRLKQNLESELKERTCELQNSLSFLKSYKDAIDSNLIVSKTDMDGNITYVNENFCKITGYKRDEIIGKTHQILRDPSTPNEFYDSLWDEIKNKKIWHGILKNISKQNKEYWVDSTITPILDANKEIVEFISIRHDITQLIRHQNALTTLATTDSLTNLKNRNALLDKINEGGSLAIVLIDIDRFSQLNDFYGHKIGDKILIETANIISKYCAQFNNSNIFRLNSDEFVILCKDMQNHNVVHRVHEIVKLINMHIFNIDDENIEISVTSAISFEEPKQLLTTVDMALKIARREAKDIKVYDSSVSLEKEYKNNLFWTKKIKKAIDNDKVVIFFQPIVNNKDLSVNRYEVLMRIIDDNEIITPFHFLDIAKKAKLYKQLTKIVILKSFEIFRENNFEFSINLSIDDILDKEINEYIIEMLEIYNVSERVIFEIVESESIENFEEIQKFIRTVKEFGCRIAIDDFGTGYSNFEYLMRLEPDFIKIDGSIIKEITNNKNSEVITSVIVDFAKKMNIQIVAEFVESKEIYQKVKVLGIDKSQGYYFSEPKATLM